MSPEKQSQIDKCHFECQKNWFLRLMFTKGREYAVEAIKPKTSGHLSKFQVYNKKLIDNVDALIEEYSHIVEYNRAVDAGVELRESVRRLRELKGNTKRPRYC